MTWLEYEVSPKEKLVYGEFMQNLLIQLLLERRLHPDKEFSWILVHKY